MTFIGYIRVSTKQQGDSGLGLAAQRTAIARHTNDEDTRIFVEVESGTGKRSRPVLTEALQAAKQAGATLVIAKLDRLARNMAFISALMESGVDFVCCDMPHANRLTLHIMAAMAQHEAEMISERTKVGLAEAKKKGKKLGGWRGVYTSRETKATIPADVLVQMQQLREDGFTLQQIADRLNEQGHRTSRGGNFSKVAVSRHLERAA